MKDVEKIQRKDQNKDDVLQEDLDNDLEYTTDDEIEEARRSLSCILFYSAIVKTQYAASIVMYQHTFT